MRKVRREQKRSVRIDIPEFSVCRGQFVGIIGSNGSGKSTFLDMLGLILSPDQAEVFDLFGQSGTPMGLSNLSDESKTKVRRQSIAYVLQQGGLLEFLTVEENLRFAERLAGRKTMNIRQVVEQLGIEDLLNSRPRKLSGGQRQKASIARALVQTPDLILADEPTSALDTQSASRLMQTFKTSIREMGSSLVMVTHDHKLVSETADKIYEFHTREASPGKIISTLLCKTKSDRSLAEAL